jgi:Leucine-rich repeat (LRR) protein
MVRFLPLFYQRSLSQRYALIARSAASTTGPDVPESEISALYDLYQSTNEVTWTWLDAGGRWNFSAPYPCTDNWQGINCSQVATAGYLHILDVELSSFNLTGTLPGTLCNLTQAQVFDFSDNQLSGTIPDSLGLCEELVVLGLNTNSELIGCIPDTLGRCTQLAELNLGSTMLTGSIPASFGQLTQLTSLRVDNTYLTGGIPGSLGQCVLLEELDLNNNMLTGTLPDSLGLCNRLQTLSVSHNLMTGTLPTEIGFCTNLTTLDVSHNDFVGTIPAAVWQLGHLSALYIYINSLSGTISPSVGKAEQLSVVDGFSNYLTGVLPSELGNCTALTALSLSGNQLSGTIPDSLTGLKQLSSIYLTTNRLTGSIPGTLGMLSQLKVLDIDGNQLEGAIPESIGNCTQLNILNLDFNLLTGTIPDVIGQCAQLGTAYVNDNLLYGSLPDSLGSCTQLYTLIVNNNLLTGTIPNSLQFCSSLNTLNLQDNQLTGTIPEVLGHCNLLGNMYLANNRLTGSIPASIFGLAFVYQINVQANRLSGTLPAAAFARTYMPMISLLCGANLLTGPIPDATSGVQLLAELGLSHNGFTGTLPSSLIAAMPFLGYLIVDNNRLTGPLPEDWSASVNTLSYLYMHENRLSGPIPESLGALTALQNLNLSSNHLTGIIPTSFQQLSSLVVLMLHNNRLRGNVAQLFDPSQQPYLTTVQVGGNRLTGTLPAELFLAPNLTSFAAVGNCFEGPLPEEAICNSVSLRALVLDGLHSAKACKRSASASHSAFKLGTLPPCLLTMPSLATLHLSGSGLTGSLPAETNISAVLTDLSLSHNLLTGKIPVSVLDRDWDKLDLSYNRLTGTLHAARAAPYGNTTKLSLQHNRLSGVIPGSMQRVGSLSLLENNMFSCRVDRSDVPQQASNNDKYTCGSDAVNNALYAWLGAAVVFAIVVLLGLNVRSISSVLRGWLGALQSPSLMKLQGLFLFADLLKTLAVGAALYCIIVLLPVYAGINSVHPSFTYKYAWTVSGVFLTGTAAFAVETTFLLLQLLICGCVAEWLLRQLPAQRPTGTVTTINPQTEATPSNTRILANTASVLVSVCVVTGVNVAFVAATLNLNGRVLTVIQILLAVFKLGFNNIVAPALQDQAKMRTVHKVSPSQVLLVLFNVIVIPCLVVMVISPACFYDALHGVDSVTSSYRYSGDCLSVVVINNVYTGLQTLACEAVHKAVDTTTYTPAFTYSYQCSSSFVTSYAPTFVIMCIISGFVLPAVQALLCVLRRNLLPNSRLHTIATAVTPRILRELPSPQDLTQARSNPLYRPPFNANKLVISLLTYLALLLTFGALFPPLAVCCAVAMVSVVLTARLMVGRYVSAALVADRQDCVDEVESACADVITPQKLRVALCLVLAVSCMFYTLFLFDTLGDEVGFAGAFWVLIVVPLLPLVVFAPLYATYHPKNRVIHTTPDEAAAKEIDTDPEAGLELHDMQDTTASEKKISLNPLHS